MTHGSERRKRNDHITVRLTAEERAIIETGANAADLTPSSYARHKLLGGPQPRSVPKRVLDRMVLSRLLGQLGKIGSNLNQIARASNSGITVYEAEVLGALDELDTARTALLRELGREP
jgi:hypothetical protein